MKIRVGTSGWHYGHWRGAFYPESLAPDAWLAFYATRFRTVEVNRSFYRLPSARAVAAWCAATPPGFRFALKASRFITHMKKLKDPEAGLAALAEVADAFGTRLGPVLFQLPPRFGANPRRFASFLAALPRHWRCAFEFRDPSWHRDDIYALLREHRCAFCIFDLGGSSAPALATADFAYVRLHGPAAAYAGRYGRRALARWLQAIRALRGVREAWVYFDNDEAAYAVSDALEMQDLAGS